MNCVKVFLCQIDKKGLKSVKVIHIYFFDLNSKMNSPEVPFLRFISVSNLLVRRYTEVSNKIFGTKIKFNQILNFNSSYISDWMVRTILWWILLLNSSSFQSFHSFSQIFLLNKTQNSSIYLVWGKLGGLSLIGTNWIFLICSIHLLCVA